MRSLSILALLSFFALTSALGVTAAPAAAADFRHGWIELGVGPIDPGSSIDFGHEFVGVVLAAPDDRSWVGRRVVGEINATCGTCDACQAGRRTHCTRRTVLGIVGRNGAMAERLSLPVENLHAVPDSLADDVAVFVEPLAAALEVTQQVPVGTPLPPV